VNLSGGVRLVSLGRHDLHSKVEVVDSLANNRSSVVMCHATTHQWRKTSVQTSLNPTPLPRPATPDSHMLRPDHYIIPTLDLFPSRQVDRIVLYDLFDQGLRNGRGRGHASTEEQGGGAC
jgi:hypothetical protein